MAFVVLGQSQARCFPISSLYFKLMALGAVYMNLYILVVSTTLLPVSLPVA